jgi:hypothetical protein
MKIDYNVIAYVLFVIVTTMTTLSYLYRSERIVAAVTVFILFVLIFTFYGVRWFKDGKSITTGSSKKGPFPPVINTCPDFLSLITRTGSSSNAGKLACVDTMGVSRNQTILKTFKKDVDEPSASEEYFFYTVYTRDMTNTAALKTAADNAMLSWEGITTS